MSKLVHGIYVGTMVLAVIAVTAYLSYIGYSYYSVSLEERFYHPQHDWFKPSGPFGHGLGIIGTFMILFGVTIYIARKRYNFLTRYLRLKYLLEFHIFLCTLGPILVLFHTAFKFGGIVSIAFWSMVAVVLSGVIGRFVYIQIPRTIEGRELTLKEVKGMKDGLSQALKKKVGMDEELLKLIAMVISDDSRSPSLKGKRLVSEVRRRLRQKKMVRRDRISVIKLIKEEISISNKIERLQTMQKLFKYWHVAHLPFALIMLIILIVHVTVTLSFGYKWIF